MFGYNVGFLIRPNDIAKYKPDFSCQKSHMLIYLEDVIHPVLCDSTSVPLLEIFSISSKPGESFESEFLKFSYRPVVTKELSHFHFKLLNLNGNFYAFSYGTTIIDLHF